MNYIYQGQLLFLFYARGILSYYIMLPAHIHTITHPCTDSGDIEHAMSEASRLHRRTHLLVPDRVSALSADHPRRDIREAACHRFR